MDCITFPIEVQTIKKKKKKNALRKGFEYPILISVSKGYAKIIRGNLSQFTMSVLNTVKNIRKGSQKLAYS